MNAINFIAAVLPTAPPEIRNLLQPTDSRCSFTGRELAFGISVDKVLSKVFTDWSYLRYRTGWVSLEAAMCILPIIPGRQGLNSLRNYSFLATGQDFKTLDNPSAFDAILHPPQGEFVLAVTFSNKKHIAYKAIVNRSTDGFWVTTDQGNVQVWKRDLDVLLPIIRAWYTVLPGKESTGQQPTYFTKKEITEGLSVSSLKKAEAYNPERYFQEDAILQQYRGTMLLELLVYLISKSIKNA